MGEKFFLNAEELVLTFTFMVVRSIMIMLLGNEPDAPSSNLGQSCLGFTFSYSLSCSQFIGEIESFGLGKAISQEKEEK